MEKPIICSSELTKDKICYIAADFGFELTKSWKKDKLCAALADIYAEEPLELITHLAFPSCEWLLEQKGLSVQDLCEKFTIIPNRNEDQAPFLFLDELNWLGLTEQDGKLPAENAAYLQSLIGIIEENHDLLRRLGTVEDCVNGIMATYGIIDEKTLIDMVHDLTGLQNKDVIEHFLYGRILLMEESVRMLDDRDDTIWWLTSDIEEPEEWVNWYIKNSKKNRHLFSLEEYVEAASKGFIGKPEGYDRIIDLMQLKGIDRTMAEMTIADAITVIQDDLSGEMPNMFELLDINCDSFSEAQMVLDLCTKLCNSLPRWIFFGYSPNEIQALRKPIVNKAPKICRNDPCPCGSGKKYKQCCGKNIN